MLVIALHVLPGAALPVALAIAGFASGVVAPSRDLIVRASTPPGAAGRVFGFVYSGLDVGAFATPVFYGCCSTTRCRTRVFYTVFAFTFAAMLTVLLLRVTNPFRSSIRSSAGQSLVRRAASRA